MRANGIDRTAFRSARPRLGIVAAGKSYGDVREALALLGLDEAAAGKLGVSLYKVGCIWPLEPQGLVAFAQGHDALLFVEEKKSFLEAQAAATFVNRADRPRLYGKHDEHGAPLLSSTRPLDPVDVAEAIVGRLHHLGVEGLRVLKPLGGGAGGAPDLATTPVRRSPYFCSGCPHNRSTRIPQGSLSMTGIGCHSHGQPHRAPRPGPAAHPDGGRGRSLGRPAPFTTTPHMFQNMGDGTYYHSGLLAVRGAVAAKVNITYKILFNDAVAMTGGQPVDGPMSVAEISAPGAGRGRGPCDVVSDRPERTTRRATWPAKGVKVTHRDDLDALQRELREVKGVSVIIYEQTCAAEKRRRRKRGKFPIPPSACSSTPRSARAAATARCSPTASASAGRDRASGASAASTSPAATRTTAASTASARASSPCAAPSRADPPRRTIDERPFAGLHAPPSRFGDRATVQRHGRPGSAARAW